MLRLQRRIPAFDGQRVDCVVFAGERELIARTAAGIARWSLDADAPVVTAAALSGDALVLGTNGGALVWLALDEYHRG
jgi:hypothetical protein